MERKKTDLTGQIFYIGENSPYKGEELLLRRKRQGLHDEILVKWVLIESPSDPGKCEKSEDKSQDSRTKEYLIWMRKDEIEACCPHLNNILHTVGSSKHKQGLVSKVGVTTTHDVVIASEEDDSLQEMADDVSNLVNRAKRMTQRLKKKSTPSSEKVLTSTVNILSAYAKLGSLANSFRQCGALDLLLDLLSSQITIVRHSASEMLRSLATFDSASRAYVLLQLTQSTEGELTTAENRQMLLDLFAETAHDENMIKFSEVFMPQVPARYIYSLLKCYLRMTSLANPSSTEDSIICRPSSLTDDFEYFLTLFHLLNELFIIFGWVDNNRSNDETDHSRSLKGASIFTGTSPVAKTVALSKYKLSSYKSRADFSNDSDYGQYIKSILRPGMKVRAREQYESVVEGDIGEYCQTNDGTPPAQFSWEGLGGDTFWVHWHHVEVIDDALKTIPVNDKVSTMTFSRPVRYHYGVSLPERSVLTRPQWWEVLCIIKSVPDNHLNVIILQLNRPNVKTFDDLLSISLSFEEVVDIVTYLDIHCPEVNTDLLSIRQEQAFIELYKTTPTEGEEVATSENNKSYKTVPPYPDPYDKEDVPTASPEFSMEPLRFLHSFLKKTSPLDMLEHAKITLSEQYSLSLFMEQKEKIEQLLQKHPKSCKVAVHSLQVIKVGIDQIATPTDRVECSLSGLFSLILKLMQTEPQSLTLQILGLECFYSLLGGSAIDDTLPLPPEELRPEPLSERIRSPLIATVISLTSATPDNGNLQMLLKAINCLVHYYHLQMTSKQKLGCISAVRHGLYILLVLLNHGDSSNIPKLMKEEWSLSELIKSLQTLMPDFSIKEQVCSRILAALPGTNEVSMETSLEAKPKESDDKNDDVEKPREVIELVSALKQYSGHTSKNPLPRLLKLFEKDDQTLSSDMSVFLLHQGVVHLTNIMETYSTSSALMENSFLLLDRLSSAGEEEACQVVLQGGLRAICMVLPSSPLKSIVKTGIQCLSNMVNYSELAVTMVTENVTPLLQTLKDKFSHETEMVSSIDMILNVLTSNVNESSQNVCILGSIFTGVLQLVMADVEEYRHSQELPCLPLLSVFTKFLSSGSGLAVANSDKCWEKLEVSSNDYRKSRLTDGESSTYWESSGRSGSHWIKLYMKKNVVIKKLCLGVNSSDSSYMPSRIVIQGGVSADNTVDLNTINIPSSHTGPYTILSNMKKHYQLIIVRIKRCQQGGIDTRVRTLTCEGGGSTLWPLFGDLFTRRTQLFYCIQSHTWIKDSTLTPLDLFDRLNGVIRHEQTFADHYLLTPVARQSLGQACRTALFNPLVTALTDKDYQGMTLMDLLKQYLSHVHCVPSSPYHTLLQTESNYEQTLLNTEVDIAQVILMSRTRRMCRLLVDCDSGMATPTFVDKKESEKNTKDNIHTSTNSTSTDTLALCWQDIVHSEVTSCLHKLDLSNPPLVNMADLLYIYDRLQQTTLELFGGHSQLALALKEGFSKAFQGLNEVLGVKFCEILCLCVDMLMDCAGKESQHLLHITETQRETILFHLAEPLQFFHNLDIAYIFEHFYRRHLSNRLLRTRSISVALERRLAQGLAHCFPHKYPLQMLVDLEESENYIKKFRRSYLLENLDQLLNQPQYQQSSSEEILELAKKFVFYQQQTFNVFILTPHHWSLRHRPLPPQLHLPHPLCTFMKDYNDFYTTICHFGIRQHEKVRKLQWTLYGDAILKYDELLLDSSTPQMIVLLQFNAANELSYDELLKSTLLSTQDLNDVLLCLTADRQAILSISSSEMGVVEEPESIYKPDTLFKINEEFIKEACSKGSRVRFHGIKLVSRGLISQASREGRSINFAHVFERRRSIIDAAIVRMMKRDKEMSVDNIAIKIIKGCGLGQFDDRISFGRFDCSYKDVCSRIERLIVDGYIKRNSTHQQMLMYIPDLSEKAPVIPQTNNTIDKKSMLKEEEEVKEKDTLVMGSSPLFESHPPLVVSLPLVSLLGLPRKRPGTSPLTNPKRKQQFSRLYSCDVYEHEDVPLINISLRTSSLSIEDIEVQIKDEVSGLAAVMKIPPDEVECLLYQCSWNKDLILQRFFVDSGGLLKECGLSEETTPLPPPPDACPICLSAISLETSVCLWCQHVCCKNCWRNYLHSQVVLLNHALTCTCPVNGCEAKPTRRFLQDLLDPESEVMIQFGKSVVRSYVQTSGWLTWCHNPQGCDQVLCRGDGINSGTCSKCGWSSCFSCTFIEAHQPASCDHMTKWIELGGFYEGMDEDARSKHLANIISKRCPGCNAQIEKDEGCLHMKCKCGHDFCWRCMKPWQPTHTDYFNCSAKASKAARDAKKFVDYNQRCTSYHKSKMFSEKLSVLVKDISDPLPMKSLSFLVDACRLLQQCHKMLLYCCVAEYFSQPNSFDYLGVLSDTLETGTSALQAFLENTLLITSDVAHSIRTLSDRKLQEGYRLVNKLEMMREKVLIGSTQHFKLGESPKLAEDITSVLQDPDLDSSVPILGHLFSVESNNNSTRSSPSQSDSESGSGSMLNRHRNQGLFDTDEEDSPYYSDPDYLHSDYDDYYDSYDDDFPF